jgi:hypothetical protein
MPKLNIYSLEVLSKKSWVPIGFFLDWKDWAKQSRKHYFYDHKDSDKEKWKYIRVTIDWTSMKKLHLWLWDELKKFDSELPRSINWWVSQKSILNAINIHIRRTEFCFIKSDLSKFFESIPRERVFSLFCAVFNCSKEVSEVLTNCITFPIWPLWSESAELTLARWLHVSSRIAIWASIDFFRFLETKIFENYNELNPRISYYIDDIWISLITTDTHTIESFVNYLKSFLENECPNLGFLSLNPSKTEVQIINSVDDFVEYLWARIYKNRKDVSSKWVQKSKDLYYRYQKTIDSKEKNILYRKLLIGKNFRKRIKST